MVEVVRANITVNQFRAKEEGSLGKVVKFVDWTYADNLIDWALSVDSATLDKIESHAMAQLPHEYALSQTSVYHIG